ncbi:MAG TPA: site-specific DNA-methyltransferase [Actinokineospora sp.]|nr:site-specific DNA-methyltransferase [Actinokineospora sp.]
MNTIVEPSILRGDARALPLADNSVDLVVTSPPYFGLRSYQDGGRHYAGQLGAEATPGEYIESLLACTREMIRVLTPSGSLFINLGDKYTGTGRRSHARESLPNPGVTRAAPRPPRDRYRHVVRDIAPAKSLMGIPWRYALRCIDELGLILRAEIIWSKPNGMPESVRDRVRRSHETWFHFTLQPRYYSAVDELRKPHAPSSLARATRAYHAGDRLTPGSSNTLNPTQFCNPAGRLPGSVWEIAPHALRVPAELGVDHFASFPMEWPRRLILGWSPHAVCTRCGQGRRRVPTGFGLDMSRQQTRRAIELAEQASLCPRHVNALRSVGLSDTCRGAAIQTGAGNNAADTLRLAAHARHVLGGYAREFLQRHPTDYADACNCADTTAPTRPAVVLDPFGGTRTTALVASVHGRLGISLDASADYCRLATWRVHDPRQRARALGDGPRNSAGQVHGDQVDDQQRTGRRHIA